MKSQLIKARKKVEKVFIDVIYSSAFRKLTKYANRGLHNDKVIFPYLILTAIFVLLGPGLGHLMVIIGFLWVALSCLHDIESLGRLVVSLEKENTRLAAENRSLRKTQKGE